MTTIDNDTTPRRPWLIMALILALLGVAVSVYSTQHHLAVKASGQTDAACNINADFNCDTVALSKYSEIGDIPVAIFGLGYFLALCVLLGMGITGSKNTKENLHAYCALVIVGVIVSLVLAGISFFNLSALCPSCIVVYGITLAQLGLLLTFRKKIPGDFSVASLISGGTTAAIIVTLVIVIFNVSGLGTQKPAPTNPETPSTALPNLSPKTEEIPLATSAYAGLGEDYRSGNDNARVIIHEFADFQCPACQKMADMLHQLSEEFGDKILIVFRNYPLDMSCNGSIRSKMHEHACQAAIMARCAGQYGKFWTYFDLVYGNQQEIDSKNLKKWGLQVGLSTEQMDTCLASPDILAKIKDDIALANKLGIDSTPTLFLNGQKVIGRRELADLRALIEDHLN